MSKLSDKISAIGVARAMRTVAAVAEAVAAAAEAEPQVRAERTGAAEVKLFGRRVPVRAVLELVRSLRRARRPA